MSEQYCGTCRGQLNSLIEMNKVTDDFSSNYYQCPCCMDVRRVNFLGIAIPENTETTPEVETGKSHVGRKIVRTTVALTILAALISSRGK